MRQEYKVAKTLMKSLKTELTGDLPAIAALLQSKGRNKDSILAHINPKEAALLKKHGGAGSKNPDTGLLEFDDEGVTIDTGAGFQGTPEQTAAAYNLQDTSATPAFSSGAAPSTGGTQAAEQAINMAAPAYSPEFTAPAPQPALNLGSQANIQGVPIAAGGLGTPGAGGISQAMGQSGIDYAAPSPTIDAKGITTQPGVAQPTQPSTGLNDQVKQALGITGGQALGAGLQGLAGILTARNAASQGQQAKNQLQALATPYQAQGAQQVSAAQAGQLSTASQQAYQAAQARAAQAAASGGISGAGVVQVNAQLENLRQQLLQGDLNIGLQIQSIGDKIAQGAIQAGVQADQYVNSLTSNYATNIARTIAGLGSTPQTPTTPTGL